MSTNDYHRPDTTRTTAEGVEYIDNGGITNDGETVGTRRETPFGSVVDGSKKAR